MARVSGAVILVLVGLVAVMRSAQAADLEEQIEICTGCHGENGLPAAPDVPIIWGMVALDRFVGY